MADPSVLPDAASRKGTPWRVQGGLWFAAAAVVAFLLYRPDTNAPFEIIDFSETLPFLTDGRNFGERFGGLVGYYLQHGRAAFALSAGLAAKWTLFEWWTPGWQWTRYFVSLAVVVLSWHLMRTLGANRLGASVGASLFVVSESVAPGWLRPSVNEPLGTLLMLVASLLACRYQATSRPAPLAVVISVLLASMIIVKETLVAATFFPVALALCRDAEGLLRPPQRSARNGLLMASGLVAIVVVSIPVLWALTQAAPGGYARQFGSGGGLLSNAIFGLLPSLIPFTPVSQPPGWAAIVADAGWLVLILAAFRLPTADASKRQHTRLLLWFALALPLARLIIYLPWPLQFPYYSIPFLLGIAIVSAIGATRLTETPGAWRVAAVLSIAAVILYSAASAGAHARRHFALRRLTDSLVTALHDLGRDAGIVRVVLAVPRTKEQAWTGLGPTLSRFAAATGRPLPDVHEILCVEASNMKALPRGVALVALRHQCHLPGEGFEGPLELAYRIDLSSLRISADSLRAQMRVGSR